MQPLTKNCVLRHGVIYLLNTLGMYLLKGSEAVSLSELAYTVQV